MPSITTVLGEAPDTLHGWHARVAADAMKAYLDGGDALARYPHVIAAIDEARARNRDVDRAACKAIAGTGLWLADQAAERGDRVHDYAEQVARYYLGSALSTRSPRPAIGSLRTTSSATPRSSTTGGAGTRFGLCSPKRRSGITTPGDMPAPSTSASK